MQPGLRWNIKDVCEIIFSKRVLKPGIAMALIAGCVAITAHAAPAKPSAQTNWCKRLSLRLPEVTAASCQSSNLALSGGLSSKGFPILYRQISAPDRDGHKPLRVLLLGGIHGDELTASSVVFKWLQQMQHPLAREFAWSVVPVVNPDGLLADRPSRVNARGVDLNRNFPTPGWKQEAPQYWAKATASDPRRFPGTGPLSEPETRWLNAEIDRFKPNVIISVHAPYGVLDFDGPAPAPERFGRLQFNRVGVYPGSLGNYSGLHRNIPVITIELPNAQAMPPAREVERIWQDMLGWIKLNVRRQQDVSPDRKAAIRVATNPVSGTNKH
ncbi:M14 family zinc carboxypeptidase [Actimicrobium antarcticum]|uniref:Peptidase M14 domain-containing protein n=1 Tax=Actimicrobium antarcticum TaxID=1051899 RepID=A0ABP7T7T5_9BURK